MVVAIGSDHGGFKYKEKLKKKFNGQIYFVDCGAFELNEADDYTDFSFAVAECVKEKRAELGIIICRTGVGAIIAANKVCGIRAGLCESVESVILARKKNDINVLSFGADNINLSTAEKIITQFIATDFEGGRHARRIEKIMSYERKRNGKK